MHCSTLLSNILITFLKHVNKQNVFIREMCRTENHFTTIGIETNLYSYWFCFLRMLSFLLKGHIVFLVSYYNLHRQAYILSQSLHCRKFHFSCESTELVSTPPDSVIKKN